MNTIQIQSSPIKEYGWVCPKCGAVMSPRERVCINCKGVLPTIVYTNYIPGQGFFN